ncbi:NADH-quinone oxidoreductase subunit D [bacterium]|nr:NADH-quinone oxidoreductase subunit D [bacterium]
MTNLFKTMEINVGPQHPSTHGVLRLILELDGEIIKSCKPVVGYLHRGIEKMAENRSYLQYLPIVDRIDYLGGFFNSYAYCDCIEHLAEIDVPDKAKYIRVLCMELNRIASHLLWLGTFMLDLGASSPLFYCFRDRERILHIFEALTGQRMMYNYFTFGGVRFDIPSDIIDKISVFIEDMPECINDYENIITDNPIFVSRCKSKGILTKKNALQYSITGPNLRASGVNLDFRKSNPYLVYDRLNFDVSSDISGDAFSRYKVRIFELHSSLKIVEQCISFIKNSSDEFLNKSVKPVMLNIDNAEYTSSVESPRGLMSCTVMAGGKNPYRVKWRTGSYYAVQVLPELLINAELADLMAIFGSLDVILPEVDK